MSTEDLRINTRDCEDPIDQRTREALGGMFTAAYKLAQNAALCQWLGIEPRLIYAWHETGHKIVNLNTHGYDFRSITEAQAAAGDTGRVEVHWPDLATRDNRETLEQSLRARQIGWTLFDTPAGYTCLIGSDRMRRDGETPQAALFAAAVALMEREVGNG